MSVRPPKRSVWPPYLNYKKFKNMIWRSDRPFWWSDRHYSAQFPWRPPMSLEGSTRAAFHEKTDPGSKYYGIFAKLSNICTNINIFRKRSVWPPKMAVWPTDCTTKLEMAVRPTFLVVWPTWWWWMANFWPLLPRRVGSNWKFSKINDFSVMVS